MIYVYVMVSTSDAHGRHLNNVIERRRDKLKRGFRQQLRRYTPIRNHIESAQREAEALAKEHVGIIRAQVAKGKAVYKNPVVVQYQDKLVVMDSLLANHPDRQAILDHLHSIVTGKAVIQPSDETKAFMRHYITRFKRPFCRSRHYEMKITPLTVNDLPLQGQYAIRRFAQVGIQRAPLAGRSEQLNAIMAFHINKKSVWDFNTSAYDAGVTFQATHVDKVATFIDFKYEIKSSRSLLDVISRPHLIRYYYAKAMGMPETWGQVSHCGVYINPRISNIAELMYNQNVEPQVIRDFAKHRYKKYRSLRDILQGI